MLHSIASMLATSAYSAALSALTTHPAPAELQPLSTASSTRQLGLPILSPRHKGAVCMSPGCRHAMRSPTRSQRPDQAFLLSFSNKSSTGLCSQASSIIGVCIGVCTSTDSHTRRPRAQQLARAPGPLPVRPVGQQQGVVASPIRHSYPRLPCGPGCCQRLQLLWRLRPRQSDLSVRATRPRSVSESAASKNSCLLCLQPTCFELREAARASPAFQELERA
ncbi:hypothetical protein BU16DRAFT_598600 [Lophium mytilinum]|uniref:Secreted protein n=1 Tax=Lophium mytilinum TaxID=390894 RepID=A0A6A6QC13_9PEZI|nr:hypothetical protein BU16DRAFT_598600 [Lophium mytilinum]